MNASTDWLIGNAVHGAVELLVWSWQALVLTTLVWLGMKIWRPTSPSLRHHIWLFGLIAVALLPLTTRLAERFPAVQPANPALRYVIEAPRTVIDLDTPLVTTPASVRPEPVKPTALIRNAAGTRLIPLALFGAWFAGALFALIRMTTSHFKMRQALHSGQLVAPGELDCADNQLLITGRVSLRLSDGVQSPILIGLFRPTILLPVDVVEWTTPAERRAMIQHELAHARRRDTLINLFQATLQSVFFFHPLVRYVCRQLCLEREVACDDHVVALGTTAEAYAESILKVAERCISRAGAPAGVHHLALFSARKILERRIEMILNRNRVRVIARQWRYLILPALLIAVVAWLLAPGSIAKPGSKQEVARQQIDTAGLKDMLVKYMGDSKAYDDLIDMALNNDDIELRQRAVIRLTSIEGDGSTAALVELYSRSNDPSVKEIVIHNLGRRSEIEPLTVIAQTDESSQFRELAREVIKWMKETSDTNEVRLDVNLAQAKLEGAIDKKDLLALSEKVAGQHEAALKDALIVSARYAEYREKSQLPPPPPPPPPHPESLTVSVDSALVSDPEDQQNQPVFVLLREAVYASLRHDASVFERILADDYIGTDPDGRIFNRAQEIAEVRRLDYNVKKFVFDGYTVSGDEQMAVANFIGTVYFYLGNAEATAQFRYTVTLAKRNDQWKVVAIHMSRKL